jgi:hypothetical protein
MFIVLEFDGTQFIDSGFAARQLFNERLFRPGERTRRFRRASGAGPPFD